MANKEGALGSTPLSVGEFDPNDPNKLEQINSRLKWLRKDSIALTHSIHSKLNSSGFSFGFGLVVSGVIYSQEGIRIASGLTALIALGMSITPLVDAYRSHQAFSINTSEMSALTKALATHHLNSPH